MSNYFAKSNYSCELNHLTAQLFDHLTRPEVTINTPKTCFQLLASRHYRPTNFKKGSQPQYHAGILCLTHNDKFSMLLSTKREFLLRLQMKELYNRRSLKMSVNEYKKLAHALDMLPGGFPKTASGVELQILKKDILARRSTRGKQHDRHERDSRWDSRKVQFTTGRN